MIEVVLVIEEEDVDGVGVFGTDDEDDDVIDKGSDGLEIVDDGAVVVGAIDGI